MEKEDINKCRLCFIKSEENINIFSEEGIKLNIAEILTKHFWFETQRDDQFGKLLCYSCWECIKSFHELYKKVYEIHKSYENVQTQSGTEDISLDDVQNNINESNIIFTVNIEHDIIKTVQNDDISNQEVDNSFDNDNVVDEDTESEESDDEDDDDNEDKSVGSFKTGKKQKLKQNMNKVKMMEEDQQIRYYFKMDCELCQEKFDMFMQVKKHYRVKHNVNGFLMCCNKKFFQRTNVLEHIQRHINPDAFRCIICNKLYADKPCLLKHMEIHSQPNKVKPYKCTECDRSFGKKYNLDQHLIRHKNDTLNKDKLKKINCEECGKTFVSKSKYLSHKRVIHDGAYAHMCEICAKVFKSKIFYEKHRESFHSTVAKPKVQCELCGAWLKHERSLQSHMRIHKGTDEANICNFCGKDFLNARSLVDHKKYVHLSERSHKCSVCEKGFKRPIELKEHMTTHTGEILYTCPHCPKTFNSGANMHSHRKKVHTEEWLANRRNKGLNP